MTARWYLVQHYGGGMRIGYAGRYRHVAEERIRDAARADWPARYFVIVTARSKQEAFAKAEPILLERFACQ